MWVDRTIDVDWRSSLIDHDRTPSIHRRFLGTRLKSHRFPFEKLTVIDTTMWGRIVVVSTFKDRILDCKGRCSSGAPTAWKVTLILDFWYCLTSYTNYTCRFELDFFFNFSSKLIFPWADFCFETSFGKLSASWFSPISLHGRNSQNSLRNTRLTRLTLGFWLSFFFLGPSFDFLFLMNL